MENKIVLEIIMKNLEEIKFLFETMLKDEKTDPLLIEITTLKAKTLYQELRLLLPASSLNKFDDQYTETTEEALPSTDTVEETAEETIVPEDLPVEDETKDSPSAPTEEPEMPKMEEPILASETDNEEEAAIEGTSQQEEEEAPVLEIKPEEMAEQEPISEISLKEDEILFIDEPVANIYQNETEEPGEDTPTENKEPESVPEEVITTEPTEETTPVIEAEPEVQPEISEPEAIAIEEQEQPVVTEQEVKAPVPEEEVTLPVEEPSEKPQPATEPVIEEKPEEEPIPVTEETTPTVITNEENLITEDADESNGKKVLGEQFVKEPSLHDKLSSANNHESKIKGKPVTTLKGAIGLNDRFLFTRELFGNDSSRYEAAIDQLDQFASFIEAIEYLEQNFRWTKNNTSLKFMNLLKRRFED